MINGRYRSPSDEPRERSRDSKRSRGPVPRPNKRLFRYEARIFRFNIPTQYLQLAIIESMILLASPLFGHISRFGDLGWSGLAGGIGFNNAMYALIMLLSLVSFGCYQHQPNNRAKYLILRIAASLVVGLVTLAVIYFLIPELSVGRGVLGLSFAASLAGLIAVRIAFRKIVGVKNMRLQVLVLGAGESARALKRARVAGELDGVSLLGFVPVASDVTHESKLNLIYHTGSLAKCAIDMKIDALVLALDERRLGLPVQDLMDCRMSGIEVLDLSTFFERNSGKIRLDSLNPSWIFLSDGFNECLSRRFTKRVFDLFSVLLFLPVALPIGLLAAIGISIESKGKDGVLYSQQRVGENGELFDIYKFRSMVPGAEPDGVASWADEDDPRVTRVGSILRKFRFDELPQLYNVLKGEMSLVGPRPERPEFVNQLADAIPYYNERHRLKPGLTGWAQIRLPYGASEEDARDKFQYDLYYVKNFSLLLDMFILLQTVEVVLRRKGAV